MNKGILEQHYFSKLLEYFPIEKCEEDFYSTFEFDSSFKEEEHFRENYDQALNIFKNKTWDQVDFSTLKSDYSYTLPLTTAGMLYYLPAFLHNYYNKDERGGWKSSFICDLAYGFWGASKNNDKAETHHQEYKYFEENLTLLQSKMVAVFLMNEANLFDSPIAQQGLTNYWGNFLLF